MNPRRQMVQEIARVCGVGAPGVFVAMLQVPREEFVPIRHRYLAYKDTPIPIGYGQTISQPYTVAFMTSLLRLKGNEKVLEIGTGSGYQAAVLAKLARKVYTIERIPELAGKAKKVLKHLGYKNVEVKTGSGEFGWKEKSLFDAILITAGVVSVPKSLFDQLTDRGVLVAPVGRGPERIMTKYFKEKNKIRKQEYGVFYFVPFIED